MDHFPGVDFNFSDLTIISLSQANVTENDSEDVIKKVSTIVFVVFDSVYEYLF